MKAITKNLIEKMGEDIMKKLKKILKIVTITLASIIALLFIIYLILPKGPKDLMEFDDPYQVSRSSVTGDEYMASTGTPWATDTAMDVMDSGGNAYDAMAASLLTLNVTHGEAASFPSVVPLIIHDAETKEIMTYNGVGVAPAKATIAEFGERGHDTVPNLNILSQLIPSSPDMLIKILQEKGTMSFSEIAAPAIEIAREGFPVHSVMAHNLDLSLIERFGMNLILPYNGKVYLDGEWWRSLHHSDRFTRPELATTFEKMAQIEQEAVASGKNREEALQAVRDYFYKGEIADKIIALHEDKDGLFTYEDLANYEGDWEKPVEGSYEDYSIFTNGTWTQGPVMPIILQILEGVDLKSMGHNSPQYMHTVLQAIELAMADREVYFGDPDFVNVPIEGLTSKEYAAERRSELTDKAFGELPAWGNPYDFQETIGEPFEPVVELEKYKQKKKLGMKFGKDTSSIAIVDREGNSISLTVSDFPESPMVPGTGLTLGTRMTQFRLDEGNVNALEPGKRPRITPNPMMIKKDDEFYMTITTPGGDMQSQAMVQVFLNHVVFGMDIQEAIEAPRFGSMNFPDSFSPHDYHPGTIKLEESLYDEHAEAMEKLRYIVDENGHFAIDMGAVVAIIKDPETSKLIGGADPRAESWAEGK